MPRKRPPPLQIPSVVVPVIYAEITYQDVLEAGVPEFESQLFLSLCGLGQGIRLSELQLPPH